MQYMAGKKRGSPSSNSTYKLKIFSFSKPYDTKWKKGPIARSGHRIVCNEKSMFAIGGYNPNVPVANMYSEGSEGRATVFHEIWRFDFDTNIWTKLECRNMTSELASCATAVSGNLMFLYGGTGVPFGNKINEDVSVCNLFRSHSVIEFNQINIAGCTKPPKQYGQSVVVNGRYLYTVGGTDGYVYSMDVYRLDLRTKIWEKLSKTNDRGKPQSRYRQEVVLYNDYLIVFGGGTSEEAFDFEKLPAFNLKIQKWENFDTVSDERFVYGFPEKRRCHACVQDPYDEAIVFINGGVNNEVTFNDTWRLDLRTFKWTAIPKLDLPNGIFFHTAAATPEGKMVVYGGVITQSDEAIRTSDVYTSWITIPKLKHACWEAVLHYVKNGIIQVSSNIRTLGLPPQYEERLMKCL